MAKPIVPVKDVMEEIKASQNAAGKTILNRFNKKKFEKLLRAMANDVDFVTQVAVVRKGELDTVEDVAVTAGFRKFCKHVVEKAGMDKAESPKVLEAEFSVDSMEGLYEFMATAMFLYMEAGNKFDLLPKEDFTGSIFIRNQKPSKRVQDVYHPKTRENLGKIEIQKDTHRTLGMKSACPKYLKKCRKL